MTEDIKHETKIGLTPWILRRYYSPQYNSFFYIFSIKTTIRERKIEKDIRTVPGKYRTEKEQSIKELNEFFEKEKNQKIYFIIDKYSFENKNGEKRYFVLKSEEKYLKLKFKYNSDESIVDYTARRMIHLNEIIMEEIK